MGARRVYSILYITCSPRTRNLIRMLDMFECVLDVFGLISTTHPIPPPFSEIRTTVALPALTRPSPDPSTPPPPLPTASPTPIFLRAERSGKGGGNVLHRIMGAKVSTQGSGGVAGALAPGDAAPGWQECV